MNTSTVLELAKGIRTFCSSHADPVRAQRYTRFFTEGYDAHGVPQELYEAEVERVASATQNTLSLADILRLGDELIPGKYEEASFAIVLTARRTGDMTADEVEHVGTWLESGIRNWAHTDVLCGMILTPLLQDGRASLDTLSSWRFSDSKWKRRAAAVALTRMVDRGSPEEYLAFVEPLMRDDDRMVQQGVGWLLRELWKVHPAPTEQFLLKWKDEAPRRIYQYATEKMTPEQRNAFKAERRLRAVR